MENGFIVLHRKIIKWEWYTDNNVFKLFLHLLLRANHEDKYWRGILVKRGQLITSIKHLSDETGLSIKQVRTALDKLKSTGEVVSKVQSHYTLVTIEKYSDYQDMKDKEGEQTASKRTNKVQTKGNKQQ